MRRNRQTWTPGDVPDHVKALNRSVFGDSRAADMPKAGNTDIGTAPPVETVKAKRTRIPLEEKRSGAEQRWLDTIARQLRNDGNVLFIHEQVRWNFPDGTSYKVDFVVIFSDRPPLCVEIKAGYKGNGWEEGDERYRRARDLWPHMAWRMYVRDKGVWRIKE